ncbi:MAG: hypothetical protein BYD32DRAFT_433221 [Podila humilis]|nr:MAG: hypothetical protein BYD32DRAFT_433221 [Podila humilis]
MTMHSTLQKLNSKHGSPFESQVLWRDIQAAVGEFSHLERCDRRYFLEVDDEYKVCEPERVLYTGKTYVVISRKDKTTTENNINVARYDRLHSVLAKSKSLDRHQFLIIFANIEYQPSELLDQIETLSRNSAVEHTDIAAWRHRLSELDTNMRALDMFKGQAHHEGTSFYRIQLSQTLSRTAEGSQSVERPRSNNTPIPIVFSL